jgi:hypothetical protein
MLADKERVIEKLSQSNAQLKIEIDLLLWYNAPPPQPVQ